MRDELIKRLWECASGECFNCSQYTETTNASVCSKELMKQAADAIEELSKRETPMRVRITTSTKRCPSCNKQLSGRWNIHRNYRFCRWCGQALDWTEPPKEELA